MGATFGCKPTTPDDLTMYADGGVSMEFAAQPAAIDFTEAAAWAQAECGIEATVHLLQSIPVAKDVLSGLFKLWKMCKEHHELQGWVKKILEDVAAIAKLVPTLAEGEEKRLVSQAMETVKGDIDNIGLLARLVPADVQRKLKDVHNHLYQRLTVAAQKITFDEDVARRTVEEQLQDARRPLSGQDGRLPPMENWAASTLTTETAATVDAAPAIWGQSGHCVLKDQHAPIALGADARCDACLSGCEAPVALAIKLVRRQHFVWPLCDDVWLCREDLADALQLKDGMVLRLADARRGPAIRLQITGDCLKVLQHPEGNELGAFTGNFDLGRGPESTEGFERCEVPCGNIVSRHHAAVWRRGSAWWWEAHPARPEVDLQRLRATWVQLVRGTAYHLPWGVRDGRVAISAGGAKCQIECP